MLTNIATKSKTITYLTKCPRYNIVAILLMTPFFWHQSSPSLCMCMCLNVSFSLSLHKSPWRLSNRRKRKKMKDEYMPLVFFSYFLLFSPPYQGNWITYSVLYDDGDEVEFWVESHCNSTQQLQQQMQALALFI